MHCACYGFDPVGLVNDIRLTAELAKEHSGTRPDPHVASSAADFDTLVGGQSFPTIPSEGPIAMMMS